MKWDQYCMIQKSPAVKNLVLLLGSNVSTDWGQASSHRQWRGILTANNFAQLREPRAECESWWSGTRLQRRLLLMGGESKVRIGSDFLQHGASFFKYARSQITVQADDVGIRSRNYSSLWKCHAFLNTQSGGIITFKHYFRPRSKYSQEKDTKMSYKGVLMSILVDIHIIGQVLWFPLALMSK